MKSKTALWRESASLIILAKNRPQNSKFNYNVLMFNRTEKTSFMPNHAVFPGGVTEPDDESVLWMKYFKKFGIQDKWLKDLSVVGGSRPGIFKRSGLNHMEKEVALRITAIRETFEEIGLFLCRDKDTLNSRHGYGSFTENFDVHHWQQKVHNDPTMFLEMCQELNVVPDLWSLHEWSVWLTPAAFTKRFETAFYLVVLNEEPNLLCEEHEVAQCLWKDPIEYFEAYNNGTVWLPPPQIYELARLAGVTNIEDVRKFAAERNSRGSTVYLPIPYKCNDGMVGVLPGDECYPSNPNECMNVENIDENAFDFCSKAKKCHRYILRGINQANVILNFKPLDDHLPPVDITNFGSKL